VTSGGVHFAMPCASSSDKHTLTDKALGGPTFDHLVNFESALPPVVYFEGWVQPFKCLILNFLRCLRRTCQNNSPSNFGNVQWKLSMCFKIKKNKKWKCGKGKEGLAFSIVLSFTSYFPSIPKLTSFPSTESSYFLYFLLNIEILYIFSFYILLMF